MERARDRLARHTHTTHKLRVRIVSRAGRSSGSINQVVVAAADDGRRHHSTPPLLLNLQRIVNLLMIYLTHTRFINCNIVEKKAKQKKEEKSQKPKELA